MILCEQWGLLSKIIAMNAIYEANKLTSAILDFSNVMLYIGTINLSL